MHKHRYAQYALAFAACAVAGLALGLWRLGLAPIYAYGSSINIVVLLLYGCDKRQAIVEGARVPELVLHGGALLGGSPGALLGQGLFRHKTRKFSFQIVFAGIIVLQMAAVCSYWYLMHGR